MTTSATTPATTVPATAPTSTTVKPAPAAELRPEAVGQAVAEGPISGGNGSIVLGPGGLDLARVGYTQDEYFLTGTASAYESADALSSRGDWSVEAVEPAPYTTRIVVRRPIDPAAFNGSVAVEWLNVTAGFDNAPDWTYSHTELIRSGWVWVGVSAQAVGILGGSNTLGAALALKAADPVRYESLNHPGDSYSYDVFSQAGATVRTQFKQVLGGLEPMQVIAIGESQSAFRLSTYVNAVAPLAHVFDAYLVHSRAAAGAPLSQTPLREIAAPDPMLVRTDLGVPVMNVLSETDLVGGGFGYGRARQPDTDFIRTWEIAGTAHADAYSLGLGDSDYGSGEADAALFAALSSPPSSIYGGVITCDQAINAGPHTYVVRSAIAALRTWVESGRPPASMPPVELDPVGREMVVDGRGNALGGVRTPHVDAPIAALSGVGQTGETFCGLFGTTAPFDAATLTAMYGESTTFVTQWNDAVNSAVESGAILEADAVRLREVVQSFDIASVG